MAAGRQRGGVSAGCGARGWFKQPGMRAASSAVLICALVCRASGSVYQPGKLEVDILPGDEGDVISAEVQTRLEQLLSTEAGRTKLKQHDMLRYLADEQRPPAPAVPYI